MINTKYMADYFDIEHKNILRTVRSEIESGRWGQLEFSETCYKSAQNKEMPCFDISKELAVYLVTSFRMFRGGNRTSKACSFLGQNNIESKVIIGDTTRKEIVFGEMLRRFLPNTKIVPQYFIGGYFLDFYLPECSLAIEYDEPHHTYGKNKEADKKRENEIMERFIELSGDSKPSIVRVKSGMEIEGLSEIIKQIGIDCPFSFLDVLHQ